MHRLLEEVVPEAQRVGAGLDRPNRPLFHTGRRADRAHLERVRHDQPVVPEVLAEQAVQDLAAHRRRDVAQRADDDVRGHDRLRVGLDRSLEGQEGSVLDRLHDRELVMRVLGGVAVTREVLRAGCDARSLEPAHEGGHVPRRQLPVRAERADADDRVLGVRVHVRDRREVDVHADRRQLGSHRRRDLLRQLDVVDGAESRVAGIRASRRRLEAGDVAAFLVDRDEHVPTLERSAAVSVPSCSRLSTFHAKRTTPPRPRSSHRRTHSGAVGPSKPGKTQAAASLSSEAHPLTEPAVSPNAIFRCTSRKKMTTGIAVSVDAAMSAPQSVFLLVPEK